MRETGEAEPSHALTCYVDGHRKPVYSGALLPRGLIGRLGIVLGCRALLLLHDEQGHPDAPLCLRVALIRDLRRLVLVQPDPEEARFPSRWDTDLPPDERTWWREGWQATAASAKETTAKLIPIVTTEETEPIDAVELAQTYIHRWPAQGNIIKDYLRPLGLDTNHGFAKVVVENSEVAKRRTRLEQRLVRLKQWAQSAEKCETQASRRQERLRTVYNQRSKESYRDLWEDQLSLEEQDQPDYVFRRKLQERKAERDAELEPLRIKEWHASEQCTNEFHKRKRYCKEQREVLRALEDMSDPVFRNMRFSPDTIQAGFQFGTFKE